MKSKGSHTFTTLHYESLHVVLSKNLEPYITGCGLCWAIEDQKTIYDQFMQKSIQLQRGHI